MNQMITFQNRVLFLVSGLHKEETAGNIYIYILKDKSINPVRWKILLHFHSLLGMWKQLIFKISNVTWLPRCFWSIFLQLQICFFKKINLMNIEWFLHPCANYLFISQHQMHELITSPVSVPSVCPQWTHCLNASRTLKLCV